MEQRSLIQKFSRGQQASGLAGRSRKGQQAVEMLVTVGIAIAFIVPIVLLFFTSTGPRTQQLALVQAKGLGQQLSDTAGEVWYQGNGSQKQLLVSFPDRLMDIRLHEREITLVMDNSPAGPTELVFDTPANVSSFGFQSAKQVLTYARKPDRQLRSGLVMLTFQNKGNYVNIIRQTK